MGDARRMELDEGDEVVRLYDETKKEARQLEVVNTRARVIKCLNQSGIFKSECVLSKVSCPVKGILSRHMTNVIVLLYLAP